MPAQIPTVSIITPSFNQGSYIDATICSVLSQNIAGLEYFVADGGSKDQTVEILKSHGEKLNWISEPDGGQADAINKGAAKTTGEIIGWLNSDDTYESGAVAMAVEFFREHPDVDVVYGDADYIDAGGNFIARCTHIEPFDAHRLLYYTDFLVQPATFFRRSAFEKVGGIDASLHFAMDYDLWLRMSKAGCKFAYTPKLLAHFRWFGQNKTAVGGHERLDEIERVVARAGGRGLPAYVRLEKVREYLVESATRARSGKILGAAGSFLRASGAVLGSRRAMISLCQPATWRIVRTGQVLRRARSA